MEKTKAKDDEFDEWEEENENEDAFVDWLQVTFLVMQRCCWFIKDFSSAI